MSQDDMNKRRLVIRNRKSTNRNKNRPNVIEHIDQL